MKVVNIAYAMIKLQFKLPQTLISRGFTRRTVFHAPAFQQKGINRLMDYFFFCNRNNVNTYFLRFEFSNRISLHCHCDCNFLPRASLINIYKLFIRPHLDYGDIIYDNSSNVTFSQMIQSVQYNAALAITGAIRGSSRDKLYHELGLESLHDRWYRKFCFYYKICHKNCPMYLTEFFPIVEPSCYSLRLNRPPTVPFIRTKKLKSTFFPSCTFNWNQLDPSIQNSSEASTSI